MSSSFDPYHQWLGIRDPERPPNHYRLLGIDLFESDPDVIETAADRQMAHLRTFQNGPNAFHSQQLLNEVSAARVCLLDTDGKARYDEGLRSQQPPELPPVAQGDLVDDEPASAVIVSRPPVSLRPPGRSTRSGRPWYINTSFLLPVLAIVLGLVGYRLYRDYRFAAIPSDPRSPTDVVSSPGTDEADSSNASPSFADERDNHDGDGEATSRPPAPATQQETTAAEDPTNGGPVAQEATDIATTPDVAPVPNAGDVPGWDPGAMAITGQPTNFNLDHPTGAFLYALSQRDRATADGAQQALRLNAALGVTAASLEEVALIRNVLDEFWQAADAAATELQPEESLSMRDLPFTVIERGENSVNLMAPTGQQQAFDLARDGIHRDLAVALVEHYYATTPGAAWRLSAVFLAVDRDGDIERAKHYAQRAEQQGFAARFLIQMVRRLSGHPNVRQPIVRQVTTPTDDDDAAIDANDEGPPPENAVETPQSSLAEPDRGVPSKSDLSTARREFLGPTIADFRQEKLPSEEWPARLLQTAQDPKLSRAARYVLLDYALKRARSRLDFDTALKIVDFRAAEFSQDRADMRYELLQATANRTKGEDRRRFAIFARQLAEEAVARDDYDEAIRFASLAQSLGRPVPDRWFRQSLLRFRVEIDAIKKAYQQLLGTETSNKQNATPPLSDVPADQRARFRLLAKGEFEAALPSIQVEPDAALGRLVEQELVTSKSIDDQLQLAREWSQFGRDRNGLEKANALRRARHWYHLCLNELSRADREEVLIELDRIAAVLGRDSDQFDLTAVPPLAFRVGYGTFGINQNIDAATNARVEPLPQVGRHEVTRFLWACAPSQIEYFVPKGATQFRAIGVLNAASQDGVQFRVRADNRDLFTSPVIKVMGSQIPIQVDLPEGVTTLELIVDPLKNNSMDHTYWVNPQVVF